MTLHDIALVVGTAIAVPVMILFGLIIWAAYNYGKQD
jgi:hypothetical protein